MNPPLPFRPIFAPEPSHSTNRSIGPLAPFFEKALVAITIFHLCLLPWALGTMHPLSQEGSFALGLFSLMIAITAKATAAAEHSRWLQTSLKGILFSGYFWPTGFLFLYIVIQNLNPAWKYSSDNNIWRIEPWPAIRWLPHGMATPFISSNGWRILLIWSSLVLTLSSIRLGFTTRRNYRVVLTAIAINALLLASMGLIQKIAHIDKIAGLYLPNNRQFFASFIYPNHAGAYLNLALCIIAGLCSWYLRRALLDRGGGEACAFLGFSGIIVTAAVVATYSRMSIALAGCFLLFCTVGFILLLHQSRAAFRKALPLPPFLIGVFAATILGLIALRPSSEMLIRRFTPLLNHPAQASLDRTLAREAGFDMFREYPILGWGAGNFRYGFPIYAQRIPAIYTTGEGARRVWEHVHNDPLEYAIELGIVGVLPILVLFFFVAANLIKLRFWRSGLSVCLVAGTVLALVHSSVDFVFASPAILLTWGVLVLISIRWRQLD